MDYLLPIRAAISEAITRQDSDMLDSAIERLLAAGRELTTGKPDTRLDLFHQLLVMPGHHCHQQVAFELQTIADPATLPYIRQVFEQGFDYLDYTCSDSDAIAKWFSHLLWRIDTPEALALIKEYARHPDEGIRNEMQYRLKRITQLRLKIE
ncbi:hypothetical protein CHU32_20810 [Superficieibacter electus]|uniref:Uncharacterized protein n=1 Tax=Superficieibacter electus TaxID=2022662 RepID=A0A2P5GKC6_9ENTR|nr:hypothetical protein [Superficieibacter electus]POP43233.1 hypothetical protein CHU33_16890 [Superficieibacter electus]POP44786.1 hypothetical protein CHU32_20810 [Superficieibacter electus]